MSGKEEKERKERVFILDKAGSVDLKNPKGGRIRKLKGDIVKTKDIQLAEFLKGKHFFTEINIEGEKTEKEE